MSDTLGVQFRVAGESILPGFWNQESPFINLHLISSDTPPLATDTYPYPWLEVSNPSYQAQSIPAESITVTSDSLGSYGVLGSTFWPFAPYTGDTVAVNGWWLDDRRTIPPTPLWGGTITPPFPIPVAGGMLAIDSITLTMRDCKPPPPPPPPPSGPIWVMDFGNTIYGFGTDMNGTTTFSDEHWVVLEGAWVRIDQQQCQAVPPGSTDFSAAVVECTFAYGTIGMTGRVGLHTCGICCRATSAGNYYAVEVNPGAGTLTINRHQGGVVTNLASSSMSVPSDAVWYLHVLLVEVDGIAAVLYFSNAIAAVAVTTDTAFQQDATLHGIIANGQTRGRMLAWAYSPLEL